MLFSVIATLAIAQVLLAAAPFKVETDPGGCRLERVAGAEGENHLLFRGSSPDGGALAVGWDRRIDGKTERGAYLLDLRSGERRNLPGLNNAASFSPDGKHLVAANYPGDPKLKTEIVELDLESGVTRTLASNEAMEWLPSYSPDGRWIVFNSFRSGASDLYRVERETGLVERLTDDPRYEAHAQYARDGRSVIFHRQISGDDYGLVELDLQSRLTTELPGTAKEESYPALSPDERWLAFSNDEGQEKGKTDLYAMARGGSKRTRLTSHPDKDAYAAWSPNGRHLYFMRQGASAVEIFRLEMKDGDCRRS